MRIINVIASSIWCCLLIGCSVEDTSSTSTDLTSNDPLGFTLAEESRIGNSPAYIVGLSDGSKVKKPLKRIEVKPTGNNKLRSVKLMIDNQSLGQLTTSPFVWKASDFEDEFNLEPGDHKIKLQVMPKRGSKTTLLYNITYVVSEGSTDAIDVDRRIPQYNYKAAHGVWDRVGVPDLYGVFRGRTVDAAWSAIEPYQGEFNWAPIEDKVKTAMTRNQYFFIKINVGPQSPDWLYEAGVPKVETDHTRFAHYPYYLDANYEERVVNMIDQLGARIRSWPANWREKLVFIMPQTGCTEDEVPYKGTPLQAFKSTQSIRVELSGVSIEK